MPSTDTNQAVQSQEILQDTADNRGQKIPIRSAQPINTRIAREIYERMEAFEFKQRIYFGRWNENARETLDYHQGHHWSVQDMTDILMQGRKPYEFPIVRSFAQAIIGEQIQQRTDMRCVPKTGISEDFTEAMNHYLRWALQINNWQATASDIYRDGVIIGVGVTGVSMDYNDPFGRPKIEQCYPFEFMWDIQTARDSCLNGIKELWRGTLVPVSEAIDEFPEAREQILKTAGSVDRFMYAYQTMKKPKIKAPANKLYLDATVNTWSVYNRDMVFRREFYVRRYEPRWVVRDGETNTESDFPQTQQGYSDAMAYAKTTYNFYLHPQILQQFQITSVTDPATGQQVPQPLISEPYKKNVCFVDKYVFFGTTLVYSRTVRTETLPYKFFVPEFYYGDLTSHMEHGKGLQRYVNRMAMFIDEGASGMKGGTVTNKAYLDDNKWTDDQIRRFSVQPNPNWIVDKDPSEFPIEQFIKTYPSSFNPQQASELLRLAKDNVSDMFGGPNAIGLQAFAGQSGRDAKEMHDQASVKTLPLLDKWGSTQSQVGEELIARSQDLNPSVEMYVTNEYLEPEKTSFAAHNLGEIFTPMDLSYSVEIEEVVASQTEQARKYAQLTTVMQTLLPGDPDAAGAMLPMILQNANIDPSDRREFLNNYNQAKQARQQAEAAQQQQENDVEQHKLAQEDARIAIKAKEQDFIEQNNPKISMVIKPENTPSAMMATIMQKAGIAADPKTIMQDRAVHTLFEQDKADLAQKHFDRLTPSWQRQSGNRAAKGTMTPKNKNARAKRNGGTENK